MQDTRSQQETVTQGRVDRRWAMTDRSDGVEVWGRAGALGRPQFQRALLAGTDLARIHAEVTRQLLGRI